MASHLDPNWLMVGLVALGMLGSFVVLIWRTGQAVGGIQAMQLAMTKMEGSISKLADITLGNSRDIAELKGRIVGRQNPPTV